jgi:hypothetical protein
MPDRASFDGALRVVQSPKEFASKAVQVGVNRDYRIVKPLMNFPTVLTQRSTTERPGMERFIIRVRSKAG